MAHAALATFGSVLVASGASLAYVKEQRGHASISMTVDVYGSWLLKSDVAAVNRVFGGTVLGRGGSNSVADGVSEAVAAR